MIISFILCKQEMIFLGDDLNGSNYLLKGKNQPDLIFSSQNITIVIYSGSPRLSTSLPDMEQIKIKVPFDVIRFIFSSTFN